MPEETTIDYNNLMMNSPVTSVSNCLIAQATLYIDDRDKMTMVKRCPHMQQFGKNIQLKLTHMSNTAQAVEPEH